MDSCLKTVKKMTQLNQPNPNDQSNKEVDLLEIMQYCFRAIKAFFIWLWDGLIACLIYLIRKFLWLALICLAGMALAVVLYTNAPKYYASSAIISSNSMESSIVISKLENINYLLNHKNYGELTALLGISESDAANIKSLTGYYGVMHRMGGSGMNNLPVHYIKEFDWQDTSLEISSNYFMVKALVYNEEVYPALSQGLLRYVGNNAFGLQANTLREEQIKSQIDNTKREIEAVQQAIQSYGLNNKPITIPMIGGEKQKSELVQMQEMLSRLYQHQQALERSNALFLAPATMLSDFSKTYRVANGLIKNYVAPALVASFVLGLAGLLLWDNRKKIGAAVCKKA